MTQNEYTLSIRKIEINAQILAEKRRLWDLYAKLPSGTTVVKKVPTIFTNEGKINQLRNDYHNLAKQLNISITSANDVYRDDSPTFEALRQEYIARMNDCIKEAVNEWNQEDLDPRGKLVNKTAIKEKAHANAEYWRAAIRAVGGVPIENNSSGVGSTDVGNYWGAIQAKPASSLTIDDVNNSPGPYGQGLYKYYKSFSGTDAIATLIFPGDKHIVLGEVSTLSYSIYRKKNPIITLGRISPKGFTKASRIVAGTIIFTVTNTHWVNSVREAYPNIFKNITKMKSDELPPFDIMITYANEYGANSYYVIYGVTITEEGQVVSIEDAMTENVCQFLARDIDVNRPISNTPIQGRENVAPADEDYLGKFTVSELIGDDRYQQAQTARQNIINSLKPPAIPPTPTSTITAETKQATTVSTVKPPINIDLTKPVPVNFTQDRRFLLQFFWFYKNRTGTPSIKDRTIEWTCTVVYKHLMDSSKTFKITGKGSCTDGGDNMYVPMNPWGAVTPQDSFNITMGVQVIYKIGMLTQPAEEYTCHPNGTKFDKKIMYAGVVNINLTSNEEKDTNGSRYVLKPNSVASHAQLSKLGVVITDERALPIPDRYIKWTVYMKRCGDEWKWHSNDHYSRKELEATKNSIRMTRDYVFWSKTDNEGKTYITRSVMLMFGEYEALISKYRDKDSTSDGSGFLLQMDKANMERYAGRYDTMWTGWDWEFNLNVCVCEGPNLKEITKTLNYKHIRVEGKTVWVLDE